VMFSRLSLFPLGIGVAAMFFLLDLSTSIVPLLESAVFLPPMADVVVRLVGTQLSLLCRMHLDAPVAVAVMFLFMDPRCA
jgi:hypothetical protein